MNPVPHPWDSLGIRVEDKEDVAAQLRAARLDWTVIKAPMYATLGHHRVRIPDREGLFKEDGTPLSVVSGDWQPTQNVDAVAFFSALASRHDMRVEYIGSLNEDRMVWGMLSVGEGSLFSTRMLVTSPHEYGRSLDARFMAVLRTQATIVLPLHDGSLRTTHRSREDPDQEKRVVAEIRAKHEWLSGAAEKLSRTPVVDAGAFFSEVFRGAKAATMAAAVARDVVGGDSLWDAVHAAAYVVDFRLGYSAGTRLTSAWYGINRSKKQRALEMALDRQVRREHE